MPFSLIKRGVFFQPSRMLYCLWNAHFKPVPVTNWHFNCFLLTSYSMQNGGFSWLQWKKKKNALKVLQSYSRSVPTFWGRMALATVSATLKRKQNGGKITAIIFWRSPYSKRPSLLWRTQLTQLAFVQESETVPCTTCRDRRVSSRAARTCSTSSTPFKLSPCGRTPAGLGLRFGLQRIF